MFVSEGFRSADEIAIARVFRLLPSERLLWTGRPVPGVPRPPMFVVTSLAAGAVATSALLFAALLGLSHLPGVAGCAVVALYALVFVVGAALVPRYTLDPCEFAVTTRRALWRRGTSVRSIDLDAISYARIRWHPRVRGVGTLELVRAVPFGPLARQERIVMHDVRAPDGVLATLRGVVARSSDPDSPRLVDRLDRDEQVLWGAGPEGWLLGWRDFASAGVGLVVLGLAVRYGSVAFGALRSLEEFGLPVGSEIWWLFFGACLVTFALVLAVGAGLVWWGIVRARAQGRDTEYLVTDRRVLIRRGLTELSLDRARVFDLVEIPTFRGLRHVSFILDGPGGRALGDNGALTGLLPARDVVPPVLYELRDVSALRTLFGRDEREGLA